LPAHTPLLFVVGGGVCPAVGGGVGEPPVPVVVGGGVGEPPVPVVVGDGVGEPPVPVVVGGGVGEPPVPVVVGGGVGDATGVAPIGELLMHNVNPSLWILASAYQVNVSPGASTRSLGKEVPP
jgi:hypothetical protein